MPQPHTQEPPELKQPLSLFEKIGKGIKGFVKSVTDYLPKGIVFDAILMTGAIAVASTLGFDPMGLMLGSAVNWGSVVSHVMFTLALGSTISGTVGAVREINHGVKGRNAEIAAQAYELERCREHERSRGHVREYDDRGFVPQSNLPLGGKPQTRLQPR